MLNKYCRVPINMKFTLALLVLSFAGVALCKTKKEEFYEAAETVLEIDSLFTRLLQAAAELPDWTARGLVKELDQKMKTNPAGDASTEHMHLFYDAFMHIMLLRKKASDGPDPRLSLMFDIIRYNYNQIIGEQGVPKEEHVESKTKEQLDEARAAIIHQEELRKSGSDAEKKAELDAANAEINHILNDNNEEPSSEKTETEIPKEEFDSAKTDVDIKALEDETEPATIETPAE